MATRRLPSSILSGSHTVCRHHRQADLVERTLDQVSESWILMLSLPPALPSLVILSDLSDL